MSDWQACDASESMRNEVSVQEGEYVTLDAKHVVNVLDELADLRTIRAAVLAWGKARKAVGDGTREAVRKAREAGDEDWRDCQVDPMPEWEAEGTVKSIADALAAAAKEGE